jgi:hypothetical protein
VKWEVGGYEAAATYNRASGLVPSVPSVPRACASVRLQSSARKSLDAKLKKGERTNLRQSSICSHS